MKRKNR